MKITLLGHSPGQCLLHLMVLLGSRAVADRVATLSPDQQSVLPRPGLYICKFLSLGSDTIYIDRINESGYEEER